MSCIFCAIASHQAPAYAIYEDASYMAFLDIFPKASGHTLVIPKRHFRWTWDVEDFTGYMITCKKIVNHYRTITNQQLVMSMVIGQAVAHAHVHLIPALNQEHIERLYTSIEGIRSPQMTEEEGQYIVSKLALKL